jgi:hypothetical protein
VREPWCANKTPTPPPAILDRLGCNGVKALGHRAVRRSVCRPLPTCPPTVSLRVPSPQDKEAVPKKRSVGSIASVGLHRMEHGLQSAATSVVGGLKAAKNAVKTGVRHSITSLAHLGGGGSGGAGGGAGASAAGTGEPAGSVADKLASTSRRLTQVAMQRLGRTEASQDEEYERLKEELQAMRAEFATLNGHLQAFIGCVRSTSCVCLEVHKGCS